MAAQGASRDLVSEDLDVCSTSFGPARQEGNPCHCDLHGTSDQEPAVTLRFPRAPGTPHWMLLTCEPRTRPEELPPSCAFSLECHCVPLNAEPHAQ